MGRPIFFFLFAEFAKDTTSAEFAWNAAYSQKIAVFNNTEYLKGKHVQWIQALLDALNSIFKYVLTF